MGGDEVPDKTLAGANNLAQEDITKVAAEIRRLTDKPFRMTFGVPPSIQAATPLVRHHKANELFAALVRETDELLNAKSS